jgi:hypothetical protein
VTGEYLDAVINLNEKERKSLLQEDLEKSNNNLRFGLDVLG